MQNIVFSILANFPKHAIISQLYCLSIFALVAQGIEHRIPNPGVACSIHAGGTNISTS